MLGQFDCETRSMFENASRLKFDLEGMYHFKKRRTLVDLTPIARLDRRDAY